ncbi:hypothetical protein [Frankia sp. Cr1]|uniref:hypothetical protein n=1 Tax=Frankia sp. Cr1 TaxID=3073931 RepID=UPI002AD3F9FF|nr:hypothetical protein [Frankia sp. Cr1]
MADGTPSVTVDYDALHTFASTVNHQAETAAGVVQRLGTVDGTKDPAVDAALGRFHPAWRQQIQLLGQVTSALAEAIELAAAGYQGLDEALADAAPVPGGPP